MMFTQSVTSRCKSSFYLSLSYSIMVLDYQTQGAQGFNKDLERTIKKLFDGGNY